MHPFKLLKHRVGLDHALINVVIDYVKLYVACLEILFTSQLRLCMLISPFHAYYFYFCISLVDNEVCENHYVVGCMIMFMLEIGEGYYLWTCDYG